MSENADKPFEPSAEKLRKAREKGETARAPDLNAFALYLGLLLTVIVALPWSGHQMMQVGGRMLAGADTLAADALAGGNAVSAMVFGTVLKLSLAWVAAPAAVLLLAIALQRSAVFAPTKLAPKLSRISPIAGAANKFGKTGLFEFAKSAAKMTLYSLLLFAVLAWSAERLVAAAALPKGQSLTLLAQLALVFLASVTVIAAGLGTLDFYFQRHAHLMKNRMDHKELRDESKDAEGDPQMKSRRRARAQEIATNTMLADVPEATVVIVNPTRYAVALRWTPTDQSPPVCLAKGVDLVAARIRETAIEAGIPIYSDPPTARALHATVDLGDAIPREHFQAVAVAIRFAQDLKTIAGARG
ncbi:EscU/YscU/HrcU family type III secretion system export apparatus switch protein [Jannaschia aquimarina]|uniref:FlhB protein n=1 Tax=Jannaschia aquimarina TaxID=935700 RepID=A0A0D1D2G7_9RHOB|nr:flagellar type III secretion system protein FlhB [Jannaschia aquimarina]KIT14293.1 Flagellar biosynthetic protein FlhB [Jannaschia aquimarina]SNS50207.1 flagellar biosynthetic protein FlhB [Jannaschia aquimarina]